MIWVVSELLFLIWGSKRALEVSYSNNRLSSGDDT